MKASGKVLQHKLALAVWEQAHADGAEEAVERALGAVTRALRVSPKLRQVLLHPGIGLEAKMNLLRRLLPLRGAAADLLHLMVEQRSLRLLGGVLRTYRSLRAMRAAEVAATAMTAAPLSRPEIEQIRTVLERVLKRRVKLAVKTQKNLLGGLMIQVGERRVDGTVKGAFDRLERQLLAAS